MISIRMAALFILLGLLAGACGRMGSPDQIVWTDPEGDVQGVANLPDRPTPDLRKVAVGSDAGQLMVELELKGLQKRLAYAGPDGRRASAGVVWRTPRGMAKSATETQKLLDEDFSVSLWNSVSLW